MSGLLITCSAASPPTSPSPYPPMFLLSDQWDLTCNAVTGCLSGHFKVSAAVVARPVLSLWEAEKSLQCFSMCAALARSCVLLISCSYFEYWPSLLYVHISCRSASENANEAAANISHHMCSAHTEESVTGAQINMTTSLF